MAFSALKGLSKSLRRPKSGHVIDLGIGDNDEGHAPPPSTTTPPTVPSIPQRILPALNPLAPRDPYRHVRHPFPGVNIPLERTTRPLPPPIPLEPPTPNRIPSFSISRPAITIPRPPTPPPTFTVASQTAPESSPRSNSNASRRRPLPTPPSADTRASAYDIMMSGSTLILPQTNPAASSSSTSLATTTTTQPSSHSHQTRENDVTPASLISIAASSPVHSPTSPPRWQNEPEVQTTPDQSVVEDDPLPSYDMVLASVTPDD